MCDCHPGTDHPRWMPELAGPIDVLICGYDGAHYLTYRTTLCPSGCDEHGWPFEDGFQFAVALPPDCPEPDIHLALAILEDATFMIILPEEVSP